jgi:hypothetical protein
VHKLLRPRALAILNLFLVIGFACRSAGADQTTIVGDSEFASQVYVGPEAQMPLAPSKYVVSINPSRSASGQILIPRTINDALHELAAAMPPWVLNALARSHGDFECTVKVSEDYQQELDYYVLLEDWYWIHWNLRDESSSLRREFTKRHILDRFMILQALRAAICKFSKTQDTAMAISTIDKYGRTDN